MYRPVRIDVRRCLLSYSAYIVRQDDGLSEDGEERLHGMRGFDVEQGPYDGLTHRRAWRKALRAAGGKLFPEVT